MLPVFQLSHNSLMSLCLSTGVDSMSNYEQVIRQVRYYSWQPGQQTERRFRLTCSELNGRYTSNEFNLEVSVIDSLTRVDFHSCKMYHWCSPAGRKMFRQV